MKRWQPIAILCSFVVLLFAPMRAVAADAPEGTETRKPDRDAVCTKCHDENEPKPILAIYQTRHGVKADPRTPSCQSCHGTSDDHVRNPRGVSPRPEPDVVFGAKHASAPSI